MCSLQGGKLVCAHIEQGYGLCHPLQIKAPKEYAREEYSPDVASRIGRMVIFLFRSRAFALTLLTPSGYLRSRRSPYQRP